MAIEFILFVMNMSTRSFCVDWEFWLSTMSTFALS